MKKLLSLILVLSLVLLGACSKVEQKDGDKVDPQPTEEVAIKVYTRDTSSGTRAGFMGKIYFKDAAGDDSLLVDGFIIAGNSEIINAVRQDEAAIGYISLSSLTDDIIGLKFEGVEPTEENVINGSYKLARNFNYMLRDDYANETVKQISKAFVAYVTTSEGKAKITEKSAIVDLTSGESWDDVKANHPVCNADNSSVTIKFGGSDSVEKVAMGLSADFSAKCGSFVPEHNHTGSSNAWKGLNGDNKGADDALSIHIGFASREFKDSEIASTYGKLATDAIVAIVNKENSVNDVTAAQLKSIYSGEVVKWSEVK